LMKNDEIDIKGAWPKIQPTKKWGRKGTFS
jgi:hypothetical protein